MFNTPTWQELLKLWLCTSWLDKECIIFCDAHLAGPLLIDNNRFPMMVKFDPSCSISAPSQIVHAEYVIVEVPHGQLLSDYCHSFKQKEFGFVLAWDGYEFVSQNS